MRIALLQLNSRDDKAANLATITRFFDEKIAGRGVDLVVAPEYSTFLGGSREEQWAAGETFPEGAGYRALQALARRHAVTFHTGSMIEKQDNGYFNTSVIFGPDGTERARYRKIHLFDVVTPGGEVYRESDTIRRGEEIVDFALDGHRIGCAICYDMRFPELFQAHMKAGCDMLCVPAAFTMETGKDHWETLLRARAIETQCWLMAPGQVGKHRVGEADVACYGNSMIIDPWGTVVARASNVPGVIIADADFAWQDRVRSILPSNRHHVL